MLVTSPGDFDFLQIGLASPDKIRFWSHGEVEKPETINYRTFKPERKGLFCEKIFGPVKDWECSCGKYRRVRYRGIICERCGVQVTHSKVRRERMGHIELASAVSHIWFLKGIPSYMGLVLDLTTRQLEEVIYYDSYIVTDVDDGLKDVVSIKQLLSSDEYYDLKEQYGEKIKADMGAKAIKDLLAAINLEELVKELRTDLEDARGQRRLKVTKRLKIVEAMVDSGNRPEWMILDVIPVMPPDLRPMVQLEGGRFATSDLNDLYRRVVNRNNRLKRLIDIGAPEMIVRNEKRMLQEAVDVLIANGKRGRAVTGSNGRPLKSLGNIVEGKQGRFRQNLLGKRVDYSGRSVIVVGPHLKFHQCGLPKEMALELFKPFVIRKLVEDGYVTNVKTAKRKIEKRDVFVWEVLEEIIKGQPVLLNRAPTLHRLGIQAFDPILVEGSAVQIHPLVCTAFNADFDGDQMTVHVPLSLEAQAECRLLVMSTNNILAPSNGRSIITPTQDMVLGIYFLTFKNETDTASTKYFYDINEVIRAMEAKVVNYHNVIKLVEEGKLIETTVGIALFNFELRQVFQKHNISNYQYINRSIGKKELSELILEWYMEHGSDVTAELADKLKNIGFKFATLSGISISLDDLKVPSKKNKILDRAEKEVTQLEKLEEKGVISTNEKFLRSHDIWRRASSEISDEMEREFDPLNNVFIMANSGARGNIDQVRQLAGMRGLMSDAQGRTVKVPIKSNFKEGLSLAEYFISCYGARKGLVDTALRTADSGYLTRRLVDIAQDVTITEKDCETQTGQEMTAIRDSGEVTVPISGMIEGRVVFENVTRPGTKKRIVTKGQIITTKIAKEIQEAGIESVKVRAICSCKAVRGICQLCYGLDLSTGALINLGEAVGIIAAQSIGEPGTQLTMRTFHTGGVDLRKASKQVTYARNSGKFDISDISIGKISDEHGRDVWLTSNEGKAYIISAKDKTKRTYHLPKGCHLLVKDKQVVNEGDILFEFDPSFSYVTAQRGGIIRFLDIMPQVTNDKSGKKIEVTAKKDGEIFVFDPINKKVYEIPDDYAKKLIPGKRIISGTEIAPKTVMEIGGVVDSIKKLKKTDAKKQDLYSVTISFGDSYPINVDTKLFVNDKQKVQQGEVLGMQRISREEEATTKDIVQGLPRVEELFEARRYKNNAILSDLAGIVDIYEKDGIKIVAVVGKDSRKEYKVGLGVSSKVFSGRKVQVGDQLTEGVINHHDLLNTKGVEATQRSLVEEVQKVYVSQGVNINSKHVEVIVRQMIRKVSVVTMGDSNFLPNEIIDVRKFELANERLKADGKQPAEGARILLGITRASLSTESFISASSFQETAKVLSRAAVNGEKDEMYGLKENVIIGKLIPAGTGFVRYNNVVLKSLGGEEIELSEEDKAFSQMEETKVQ